MTDDDKGVPIDLTIKDPHMEALGHFHSALRLISANQKRGYLNMVERTQLYSHLAAVKGYLDQPRGEV